MSLITILALVGLLAAFINAVVYPMIVNLYFKSKKFVAIKNQIIEHTNECNELNEHIESLKLSYSHIESVDYGKANLYDDSRYNMKRRRWGIEMKNSWTHHCSASIVKNAKNQPFKYLCKYFNIQPNEETLEGFEDVLNDFSAVEQGKLLLINKRDTLISSVSNSIPPFFLNYHRNRVTQELGFEKISLSNLYFPTYTFQYVSAGGNSSSKSDIKFDIDQLDRFIDYLASLLKFKNSVAGQRALMTSKLREKIKTRDNFTCKICSLSTADERNLLLEIDHIIPLSKGGITSEDNLQTLCWKCNRSKGSKIESAEIISNPVLAQVNKKTPMNVKVDIVNTEPVKVQREVVAVVSKLDMTRPSKASPSMSSTKLDMTRLPKVSTPVKKLRSPSSEQERNAIPEKPKGLTRPQNNALRSAKEYLEYSGYSRDGLVEQLHEIDSYTVIDANIAVDSLSVNWKNQAVKSAKEYLEYSGYSRDGLIDQLHEIDSYTIIDANVAIDSLSVDWNKQAVKSAKEYLSYSGYSCNGLIEQLHEIDEYTVSQATYGAQQAGACS